MAIGFWTYLNAGKLSCNSINFNEMNLNLALTPVNPSYIFEIFLSVPIFVYFPNITIYFDNPIPFQSRHSNS